MKTLLKVCLAISIFVIIYIVFSLLRNYTQLKYEVDEPKAMNKINSIVLMQEKQLNSSIKNLWIFLIYASGNTLIILLQLKSDRKIF